MAYVRTVKTASGATAVQVVWSWRRGSRSIEHIGSAHDEVELAALKSAAATRLAAGQTELDLGISGGLEPGTLPITSSQMTHLWDGLCTAYRLLGFEEVTKGDNVFRDRHHAAGHQRLQGRPMPFAEVFYMDIIPQTSAILGRIVIAKNF